MIWQLIRLDPAWQWTPVIMLLALFFALLPEGFVLCGLLLVAGGAAAAQQQDSRFQSSLPVSVRQIFVARTLSMWAMLWLSLAVAGPVLILIHNSAVKPPGVLAIGSVWTLLLLGIQVTRLRRGFVPSWLIAIPLVIWFAHFFTLESLFAFPDYGGRLFAIAASASGPILRTTWLCIAVVFLLTWKTAPQSFPMPDAGSEPESRSSDAQGRRHPIFRTILPLSYLSIAWFLAAMLAGVQLRNVLSPLVFVLIWNMWPSIRPNVVWLRYLPISPGALLNIILLPAIALLAVGYTLGVHLPLNRLPWFKGTGNLGLVLSASTPRCNIPNVIPPDEYWVPVGTTHTPVIQAPWGETFQPAAQDLHGSVVYNPYAVGCSNTTSFLDWQFSRATLAVYGRQIPRNTQLPLAVPSPRLLALSIIFLACGLVLTLLISISDDWYRIRRLDLSRYVMLFLALFPAAMVLVSQSELTQRASRVLPASFPAALAIALLPLLAIYWIAAKVFGQLEFIDKAATPL